MVDQINTIEDSTTQTQSTVKKAANWVVEGEKQNLILKAHNFPFSILLSAIQFLAILFSWWLFQNHLISGVMVIALPMLVLLGILLPIIFYNWFFKKPQSITLSYAKPSLTPLVASVSVFTKALFLFTIIVICTIAVVAFIFEFMIKNGLVKY